MEDSLSNSSNDEFNLRRGICGFFCSFLCGSFIMYLLLVFGGDDMGDKIVYFDAYKAFISTFIGYNTGFIGFFLAQNKEICCGEEEEAEAQKKEEKRPIYQTLSFLGKSNEEINHNLWISPYSSSEKIIKKKEQEEEEEKKTEQPPFEYNGVALENLDIHRMV